MFCCLLCWHCSFCATGQLGRSVVAIKLASCRRQPTAPVVGLALGGAPITPNQLQLSLPPCLLLPGYPFQLSHNPAEE